VIYWTAGKLATRVMVFAMPLYWVAAVAGEILDGTYTTPTLCQVALALVFIAPIAWVIFFGIF
jgi:hypothetical protein